ncbi:DUF3800 domain-containing protein [Candidatus Micrarchaeota archaeon]|nr:DUF3800 domain-containing protein [Candidatus Micrarchaeota archaeon]
MIFQLYRNNKHVEYIFIDESGDLGQLGSKFFSIVALSTHEPIKIGRIIKRLRERKIKKKLKELAEIKANNSTEEIRKFVLRRLLSIECSISAIAIPKEKISSVLFSEKNKLYNIICGTLFEHISISTDKIIITIDKKDSNQLIRKDFDNYISNKIIEKQKNIILEIKHLESHVCQELQVVDFIAWTINRKFTHGDNSYYDLIKIRIKNCGKEEISL